MTRSKGICIFMIFILFLTPHTQTLNDSFRDVSETEGRQTLQTNFTQLDQNIQNLVNRWNLPGAQAAVMYNGTLVFQQSYGMAYTALQIPVENESRFRIASLSKAITAAAILTLIENGSLSLDDKMVELIPNLLPSNLSGCAYPNHSQFTTRGFGIDNITVSHLINHQGGWVKGSGLNKSPTYWHYEYHWVDNDTPWEGQNDPCIDHVGLAAEYGNGTLAPVTMESIVREWLRTPLDIAPGTGYAYSNFGYSILGQIIETISGMDYESFVKENVLAPMGISEIQIGLTLSSQSADGEVVYYDWENDTWYSFFPTVTGNTASFGNSSSMPDPYGGAFVLEEKDGSGAWISTAADYAKFIAHIDGTLDTASFDEPFNYFVSNPYDNIGTIYGSGIMYNIADNQSWYHSGSLPGTSTRFARDVVNGESVIVVLLTNTKPPCTNANCPTIAGLSWSQDQSAVMSTVFSTIDYTNLTCILGDTKQELGASCTCLPLEITWDCTPPEKTEWPENDPNLNTDPALNPPSEGNTTEHDETVVPSIGLVAMLSIIGLVAIIKRGRIEV